VRVLKPIGLAVGVFLWGVWVVVVISGYQAEEDLRESGTRTVAVVLEVREDTDDDVYADIRYVDGRGDTHVQEVDVTKMDETPEAFDEIDVAYDPADPSRVVPVDIDPVDRWTEKWIAIPFAVVLPGGLFLVVRHALRRRRETN
jgi:hypothetical protein